MKNGFSRALVIFAVLAVILIVVAYYQGSTQVAKTGFNGINQLGLTFSGRNQQGQFAPYPGGAPASGSGG